MADDMSFTTFQGYSPMIITADIPSEDAYTDNDFEFFPEMFNPLKLMKTSITNNASDVVTGAIDNVVEHVENKLNSMSTKITDIVGEFTNAKKESLIKIILDVIHAIVTPDIKSIALSAIKILLEMKIIVMTCISEVTKILTTLLKTWTGRVSTEPTSETTNVNQFNPEGLSENFNPTDWTALVGLIFTGICAFTGWQCAKPSDSVAFTKVLTKDIPNSVRGGNFLITFLNSVSGIVTKLFKYIFAKVYPMESWYYTLSEEMPDIQEWVDEVLYILSKQLDSSVACESYFIDRVYAATLYGRELVVKYALLSCPQMQMLLNLNTKINDYYDKMIAMGRHPFIRKEPFCIWVSGKPGIGKSFMTEFITSAMLKRIGYKLNGSKLFTIMPGDDFWTGCKNQPVLNMDDAFSVELGNTLEKQLNIMYMVRSPVALNPPMADLADKHLRYNPEIFYINSNKEFLNIAGVDATAIHRRRHILIRAELKDKNRPKQKMYSKAEKRGFQHLTFRIADDPSDVSTGFSDPMSYQEMLDELLPLYESEYRLELENFQRRLESNDDLYDPVDMYNDDDIDHQQSLREKVRTRFDAEVLKYKKDLENCLYTKAVRSFKSLFKDKIYSKLLGPILKKKDNTEDNILPQMDDMPCNSKFSPVLKQYFKGNTELYPLKLSSYSNDVFCTETVDEERRILFFFAFFKHIAVNDKNHYILSHNVDEVVFLWLDILYLVGKLDMTAISYDEFYDANKVIILNISYLCSVLAGLIFINELDILTDYTQCNLYFSDFRKYYFLLTNDCINIRYFKKHLLKKFGHVEWMYTHDDSSWDIAMPIHRYVKLVQALYTFTKDMENDKFMQYSSPRTRFTHIWYYFKQMKICSCRHTEERVENMHYMGHGQFNTPNGILSLDPCEIGCIFELPFIYNLWYVYWLNNNARARALWARKEFAYLPPYFHKTPLGLTIKQFDKEYFTSFRAHCTSIYQKIITSSLFSWLAWIGSIVFIITTCIAGYKMLTGVIFADPVPNPSAVSTWTPPAPVGHENAYKVPQKIFKHPTVSFHKISPQLAEDQVHIMRKILRNYFYFVCEYMNDSNVQIIIRGRTLGIEGNRALCIRHYHDTFLAAPDNARFYVETVSEGKMGHRLEIDYRSLNTTCYDLNNGFETNYFIIYMPPSYPPFKKITSLFPTFKQLQLAGRVGRIIEYGKAIHDNVIYTPHSSFLIRRKGAMEPVSCFGGFKYSLRGEGVCGSLLLSDLLRNTPIIAMHVAGGDQYGLAEPLYRELFETLPEQVISDVEELEDLGDLDAAKVSLDTTVYPRGVVKPEMAHIETGKTAIVKSMLHGVFPVLTEPNPLVPSDKRLPPNSSPMKLGCEKHGLPVRPFPAQKLNRAGEDYLRVMKTSIIPVRQTVGKLSLQDAICGNSNIPHFEKLEWNTSAGFGYDELRRENRESGKKWLFGLKEQEDGYKLVSIHPHLKKIMQHKHDLRKNKIVPCTVFVDCLKDTTQAIDKCKIPGKTRIFSISPVDFTIQFKQYFGDFLAAYTKARFNAEHAIGINCDGNEWTDLAIHLQCKGSKVVSIDYSNYGPGLALDVAHEAFRIIIEWYKYHGATEEYCNMLWIFAYEVLNAHHLCFNLIYQVNSGIPSGSPITAPLNSICNSLYVRVIWLDIFENDVMMCSLAKYHENVNYITYGDDGIMNVTDAVIDKFNINSLIDAFAKYNITCTDARKGEVTAPFTSLLGASFLSRDFLLHPTRTGKWTAGLKKRSIEGCVNWVRIKANDNRQATMMNSHQCLDLAFGWGPEYYDSLAEKLRVAWSEHNENFVYKTWNERDREIYEGDPNASFVTIPFIN